jgi:hypothetical protein
LDGLVFNGNSMDAENSFVDEEKNHYFNQELIEMLKKMMRFIVSSCRTQQ